jgi:hypothetical protein
MLGALFGTLAFLLRGRDMQSVTLAVLSLAVILLGLILGTLSNSTDKPLLSSLGARVTVWGSLIVGLAAIAYSYTML